MSTKIKDLVRQVTPGWMKLVAGENGIERQVDWVHMVGSVEIADFLKGGEIAFTTGVGLREDMTLLMLVERVWKNHACAMVINIGPYVEAISQEVIDFGNEHDFPIYEVPWKVHLADIMRLFCFTIQQAQQRTMELTAAFRYAIFTPEKEELYIPALMQRGYSVQWNYTILIVDIYGFQHPKQEIEKEAGNRKQMYVPLSQERLDVFDKLIGNYVSSEKTEAAVFTDYSRIVIVLPDSDELEGCRVGAQIKKKLEISVKKDETFFIAVGNTSSDARTIGASYQMARKIAEYSRMEECEQDVRNYNSMGIARILFHVEKREELERYYQETVGALAEYDQMNGTNLLHLLEIYLNQNGSVQIVAEELFVHRNTINYQLKKIEQILQVKISDFSVRNELAAGLVAGKLKGIS